MSTLVLPTGPVTTHRPGGAAWSASWGNVARWEPSFTNAGMESAVDPYLLAAMALVESDANQYTTLALTGKRREVIERWDAYPADGPSVGIMQVKPKLWGNIVPGADAYTPDGNIRIAARLMGDWIKRYGTWQRALVEKYFPDEDPNGTTQDGYVRAVTALMAEAKTNRPDTVPSGDVVDLLFGGARYTITAEFGQLITWRCDHCYDYFSAYGLDTVHHWAIDADGGANAKLYAPFAGTVVCAGTDAGAGAWGTGCAAFPYRPQDWGGPASNGPAGRLELLHTDGARSLILGHVRDIAVRVGQSVKAGTALAREGGQNGPHVHIEARTPGHIVDPRATFGGGAGPVITPALERADYPLWAADANTFLVTPAADLNIYQRADEASAVLDTVKRGEVFEAVAIIPGQDGKPWWLGKYKGRVPGALSRLTSYRTQVR